MVSIRTVVREIITRYKSPRYQGEEGPFARFLARDPELDREVLVNVLPKLLSNSPESQEFFAQITRAITRLDHPRIVSILRMGQEKGIPYLVTAASKEARTLVSQFTEGPVDLERASALIAKISTALEYAAAQHVSHGSLTPDHILIDERGEALVTGFGLAALAALAGVRKEDVNNPYLPPEQRLADHAPTTRGDVYSLGAILYQLITGKAPDPDPDRIAPPDQVNASITPAMSQVVLTSLAYDPAARYQSADDLLHALRSALHAPRALPPHPEGSPLQMNDLRPTDSPDDMPTFPAPLDIEQPNLEIVSQVSEEARNALAEITASITMPDPLPMPVIDWYKELDLALESDESTIARP